MAVAPILQVGHLSMVTDKGSAFQTELHFPLEINELKAVSCLHLCEYVEKALMAFWRISLTLFTPPLLQAFCPIGRGYRYPCRLDEGKSGAVSEKTQPRRNTQQQSDFPSFRWEQNRRVSAPPMLFQQSWDDIKMPQENFRPAPRSSSPLRDYDEYKAYWSRRVDLFLPND